VIPIERMPQPPRAPFDWISVTIIVLTLVAFAALWWGLQ
jgi:hypothetical protein